MVIMMTLIMLMMVMTLIYADDDDDPDLALQEVLVGRLQAGWDSQQLATSPFNFG